MCRNLILSAVVGFSTLTVIPTLFAEPPAVSTAAANAASDAPVNGSKKLGQVLAAHGGLDRWRAAKSLTYKLHDLPLSPLVSNPNTATMDLHRRAIRIDAEAFNIIWDGTSTYAYPAGDAIGFPSRFYAKGSTYFIMMPFVFADGGITATDDGTIEYAGKTYDLISINYDEKVGDVKDDYKLLVDPVTHQLAHIPHSVVEAKIERVTWTFDKWQTVGGLLLPEKLTFRGGFTPVNPPEGKQAYVTDAAITQTPPATTVYTKLPARVVLVP